LFTKLGQPAVIGEVLGGILIGPTLFGGVLSDTLFPTDIRPFLSALANLGVALFMFIVGLEFDRRLLKGKLRVAAGVSIGSIVVPLSLGTLLAWYLLDNHPADNTLGFVLFVGVAMSVTAFPVLARILTDRNLHRTTIGGLALASAAVDDVLAWSLLAGVVAMVSGVAPWQLALTIPYLVLMFAVVRPLLRRLATTHTLSRTGFAVVLVGVLLSSAATEWVGLHFIFGAFLFGVVMPADAILRVDILGRVEHLSVTFLLPVFFVVAGLKVNLSSLDATGFGELALILLVAVGGKFIGAFGAARLQGVSVRHSLALGTLMNTRGLTELVVLTVGLQLGVLDGQLYSLMVVMALVTTGMAGPLLQLLYPRDRVVEDHLAEPVRQPARAG
jgi:Kef-type K+ transport system membrane component KefB